MDVFVRMSILGTSIPSMLTWINSVCSLDTALDFSGAGFYLTPSWRISMMQDTLNNILFEDSKSLILAKHVCYYYVTLQKQCTRKDGKCMATIINNPPTNSSSGPLGIIITIAVFFVLGYLIIMYGIPAVQNMKLGGTQINVPSKIDVNVNQTK